MNLPNSLTLARIFLIPLLVVVLLTKFEGAVIFGIGKELVGAAIFAVAALTDWLDGYLARRRQQVTTFGQLMDPLADKLLIMAALLSLVQMELAPAWMVAIILGRELGVTVLRSVAFSRGVTISASPLGKIKMMSQVIAILLLILGREYLQQFFILGQIALWVVVVTALVSAADYYRRFTQVGARPKVTDFEAARRRTTEKKTPGVQPAADVLEDLDAAIGLGGFLDRVQPLAQLMGADPLAHGVAMVTGKAWFSVRKEQKQRGREQWIEGTRLRAGDRVLLVDDVISTGGSTEIALERVTALGAVVAGVIPMVDRGDIAAGRFAARGVPFVALVSYRDLGIEPVRDV